jgi:carbon monoxide dehydrogenase subunit G
MGERTEGSTEIRATPQEVMAVIADFEAYPEWASGVRQAEVRKRDAKGRGTEVYFHVSSMGFEAKYTLAYSYKARDAGVSWTTREALAGVKDIQGEYALASGESGTSVVYRLALDPSISLPGFLRRQAEKQIINTALGGLKKRVEGG